MINEKPLFFYEEMTLLSLREEEGTIAISYAPQAIAGAVLADLLLAERIAVGVDSKSVVELRDATPVGDPIVDECLSEIQSGKPATLDVWVARLAEISDLLHRAACQLAEREILRVDISKVFLIFTRKTYPEINPDPERKIVERLRAAVFTDEKLDTRTAVLISLANSANLLSYTFGQKEIKPRQQRIDEIAQRDVAGKATKDAITAYETALVVATMIPAIVTTTT